MEKTTFEEILRGGQIWPISYLALSPLNRIFWRSVEEAILIDCHMLFHGELLVFMQKVALILIYYKDFMDTEVFT